LALSKRFTSERRSIQTHLRRAEHTHKGNNCINDDEGQAKWQVDGGPLIHPTCVTHPAATKKKVGGCNSSLVASVISHFRLQLVASSNLPPNPTTPTPLFIKNSRIICLMPAHSLSPRFLAEANIKANASSTYQSFSSSDG
jgi:hypothetical protein